MKHVLIKTVAVSLAAMIIVTPLALTAEAKGRKTKTMSQSQTLTASITQEEALSVALKDAGVSQTDITLTKSKLDYDDGAVEYEFKFYAGNTKYEYDIDATTGAIREREIKAQNSAAASAVTDSTALIGEQAAKEIAFKDAGTTESAISYLKKCVLKTKKSGAYYKVEFYLNNLEYEYKIDAATGTILKKEIDS